MTTLSFNIIITALCLTTWTVLWLCLPGQGYALENEAAIFQKAHKLQQSGQFEQAKSVYQAVLQQDSQNVQALIQLAMLAARNTHEPASRQQALRYLQQASRSAAASDYPEATLGQVEGMQARLKAYWALDPFMPQPDLMPQAQEHLKQAMELAPNNQDVLVAQGYMAMQHPTPSNQRLAEFSFRKALSQQRDFLPAHHALIRLFRQMDQTQLAKSALMQTLEVAPQDADTALLTALLLADRGNPPMALEYAEKSKQLDPSLNLERDALIASQLEKMGQLGQAQQQYEAIAQRAPNHWQTQERLMEIYWSTGQIPQAQKAFERVVASQPDRVNRMREAARQALRQGQDETALAQWMKLMQLANRPELTVEALDTLATIRFSQYINQNVSSTGLLSAIQQEIPLFRQYGDALMASHPSLKLSAIKLQLAGFGALHPEAPPFFSLNYVFPPDMPARLEPLTLSNEDTLAAEALFLLKRLGEAQERFRFVDGLSPEDFLIWGDRWSRMKAFEGAEIAYQRGKSFNPQLPVEKGLQHIQQQKSLATQWVERGDAAFQAKQYPEAQTAYQQATSVYPEWTTAYLRLADAAEKQKQYALALNAYQYATGLQPNLMTSEGFAKKLHKLEKKASK